MLAETNMMVLVTPAASVPGQWVAHCLNLDVVTQGESIQHAFMMAREAVEQVVADDLAAGLDPLDRPSASEECWTLVEAIMRGGRPLSTIDDPRAVRAAVAFLQVSVPRDALPEHARPLVVEMAPAPWQMAALEELRNSQSLPC